MCHRPWVARSPWSEIPARQAGELVPVNVHGWWVSRVSRVGRGCSLARVCCSPWWVPCSFGGRIFFCGQELFGLYKFTGTHDVKRLVDEVVIMISHYESAMQEATLWWTFRYKSPFSIGKPSTSGGISKQPGRHRLGPDHLRLIFLV